jgi:hypothetical protein
MSHLVGIVDDARASWDAYIADLRSKEQALNSAEYRLRSMVDDVGSLDGENARLWNEAMTEIQSARTKTGWLVQSVNSVGAWWTNMNTGPLGQTSDEMMGPGTLPPGLLGLSGMGALGIAWLAPVPLAAIIAAIAIMASALSFVSERIGLLDARMRQYNGFVKDGVAPSQAWQMANTNVPESMLESVKKISYVGLAAIAAIFVLPLLMKGKR